MNHNLLDRNTLIQAIADRFREDGRVYAYWLEGSDGTNRLDAYSDVDVVLDVEDGCEESVLADLAEALRTYGPLDISHGPTRPGPKLWYQVYHLEAAPPTLLLDVTVQSHSRSFAFTVENEHEVPKVIFDKASVIRYKNADFAAIAAAHAGRLADLEGVFAQRIRAVKFALRGRFLEAHAYYHKYVLHPLIELLRMRHTPLITDYYLVHISDHLPAEIVLQLEELHRLTDASDIVRHVERAAELFQSTRTELLHAWPAQ